MTIRRRNGFGVYTFCIISNINPCAENDFGEPTKRVLFACEFPASDQFSLQDWSNCVFCLTTIFCNLARLALHLRFRMAIWYNCTRQAEREAFEDNSKYLILWNWVAVGLLYRYQLAHCGRNVICEQYVEECTSSRGIRYVPERYDTRRRCTLSEYLVPCVDVLWTHCDNLAKLPVEVYYMLNRIDY